MFSNFTKLLLITLAIVLLAGGSGCTSSTGHTHSKFNFEELRNKDKAELIKEAAFREDKFQYGKALGSVVFPVYFPLVLPDGFDLVESSIELAKPNRNDMNNMEGEYGKVVVRYKRGDDTITVYEGRAFYDKSDTLEKRDLDLGNDKPYGNYQKKASGYVYISWRESFNNFPTKFNAPNNDVGNGGQYAFYENNIQYAIKAKGVDEDQLIGMAKSMTIYDDEWSDTNKNASLGMWQTGKVPWDDKKNQNWQNFIPAIGNYQYPNHQDKP